MAGKSATNTQSVINAKKRLTKFLRTQQELPSEILSREAPRIEAEAKLLTPFKEGKLEHSVKCSVSRSRTKPGLNISASARHNGYNYAGIQHENVYYQHPIKGQAHYLSEPFQKGIRRIKYAIQKEMRLK